MQKYQNKIFCLEVWGDYACFTRPEMKVERVSYDVITPSAARAIFEAILWKPAIRWQIKKVEVLNPIKFDSVRRNEVGTVMHTASKGIYIDESKNRQQRASLILKDVHYRITAELVFIPPAKRAVTSNPVPDALISEDEKSDYRKDENPGKYNAMFERRAKKGQCFNQPYLGTREFSCSFKLINPETKDPAPIDETRDLGFMLYDMDFSIPEDPKPAFFRAKLVDGIVLIPDWESDEVRQ